MGILVLVLLALGQHACVEREDSGGLQLEGRIGGDVRHGAAEQIQRLGYLVAIQQMLGLGQVLLDLRGLLNAGVAEKLVHGDAEVVGDGGEGVHVGIANPRLPAGNGLRRYAQMIGQLVLSHVVFLAEQANLFADLDFGFHVCKFLSVVMGIPYSHCTTHYRKSQ